MSKGFPSGAHATMTYLQLLQQDLEDMERNDMTRGRASAPGHVPTDRRRQLLAARSRLKGLYVLLAVCTTIADNLEERPGFSQEAMMLLGSFMPNGNELSGMCNSVSDYPLVELALLELDERVSLARRVTGAWLAASPARTDMKIDPALVADIWRKACGAALKVANSLEDAVGDYPGFVEVDNTVELLSQAISGRLPCCDAIGRLSIPGWAERRTNHRLRCDLPVRYESGNVFENARLLNISRTGAGLACPRLAEVGDRVKLYINNRVIDAIVEWVGNGKMGLSWLKLLHDSDSIFDVCNSPSKGTFPG